MPSIVETVTGPKVVEELGITLPHEHLGVDVTNLYCKPPKMPQPLIDQLNCEHINSTNRGIVKEYPYCSTSNIRFDVETESAVLKDLKEFYQYGGRTIMESTSTGFGKRDIEIIESLSRKSNVNIILGTGYYDSNNLKIVNKDRTGLKEALYTRMKKDILMNIQYAENIRAGFIGELNCSAELTEKESDLFQAAGQVQQELGCLITVSPPNKNVAYVVLENIRKGGGVESKVLICHADRIFKNPNELLYFFENSECYFSFDHFGNETPLSQFIPNIRTRSDIENIQFLKIMKDTVSKYIIRPLDRIVLSHDIHTKHKLSIFGGCGFSHILRNILPAMENAGFTENDIEKMTIQNIQKMMRNCSILDKTGNVSKIISD